MEETSKENTTGSGCETKHGKENSDNGNDEKCDDDDGKQSDDDNGEHCDNDNRNDVNSAENQFLFTTVDSWNDLLFKQCENPLLNAEVQISLLKMQCKGLQDYAKENLIIQKKENI